MSSFDGAAFDAEAFDAAPPIVTCSGGATAWAEGDAPVVVDAALTVDGDPTSALVRLAPYQAAGDVLAFVDQLGITGVWDAVAGELRLTGDTTAANYQTALRSITYTNIAAAPGQVTRVASFSASDAGTGPESTKDLTVTATTEVTFASGEATVGLSWIETYHVDGADAAKTFVWAPVDLNDPATYYGGYKDPRVLAFGEITRALSDDRGQYESSEFSWIVSDTDHLVRAWLGNAYQRYVLNRQVVIRMIDDAARRLQAVPRTLARGMIRAFKPRGPLHFEFRALDFVASLFGSANDPQQIPPEAIGRVQFPACPTSALGKPVPLLYGDLSNALSDTAAPVLTGTASRGAFSDAGVWNMGFGDLASAAAIPTGLAAVAAPGGTLSADVPNAEYGVMVTAVDAAGVESDPAPFYSDGGVGSFAVGPVTGVVVDGTEQLSVSWSAAAAAVTYRVYLGWYYYGFRPTQFLEVVAPTLSCAFTANPGWAATVTVDNITPGAQLIQFTQFWWYAVAAVLADGETALSSEAFWVGRTHRRPARLEWLAVAGATAYRIYRRGAAGTWDRRWEIAAPATHFNDDMLDTNVTYIDGAITLAGVVPVTYVGIEQDDEAFPWHAFLVCGHQVTEISAAFQGGVKVDPGAYGVTVLVPGQAGYGAYFAGHTGTPPYMTVNGRRYTMVYMRGADGDAAADGTRPLTLNLQGRTDADDGVLIEPLAAIYKDFVINFGFQDSAGAHLAAPVWPTDLDATVRSKVDEASFDTVEAIHAVRIAGGYPGGLAFGAEGEFITLREAIARLNVSADCRSGFNRHSEFFVTTFDHRLSALTGAAEYTQLHDIVRDSFSLDPAADLVENVVVYSYRRTYAPTSGGRAWDQEDQEVSDADAITRLREERRGRVLELYGVRNATVASDIAQRRLLLYKDPPVPVTLQTNLRGLATELGDVVLATHLDGTGATGWSLRPLLVLRHVTDPSRYTVRFVALDVERLYAGTFILGDETALAASWATAGAADRAYGYLGDETTGQFSDGAAIKRLR